MRPLHVALTGAALVGVFATCRPIEAQLQAGPTLLEIHGGGTSTRLLLRNPENRTVAAQVRVYAWSQPGGTDHLEPTEEIAVSPPIAELPPGGEQVVRVVLLGSTPESRDQSYRVVVDELPPPKGQSSGTVDFRMRYVIPAFVRAPDASEPALECEVSGDALTCLNPGGRPAQLGASSLVDEEGGWLQLSDGLYGYVLPGSYRTWTLPEGHATLDRASLRLETRLNGRSLTVGVTSLP